MNCTKNEKVVFYKKRGKTSFQTNKYLHKGL